MHLEGEACTAEGGGDEQVPVQGYPQKMDLCDEH